MIERDHLLKEVWESHGYPSSNGSLNEYISILRKTLTSLTDIEETIVTVSKTGFLYSPDIDITLCEEGPEEKTKDEQSAPPAEVVEKRKKALRQSHIVLMFLIIIALSLNINELLKSNSPHAYGKLATLYDIGYCQVKSYLHVSERQNDDIHKIVDDIHPYLKEQCLSQPAMIIVQIPRNVLNGQTGRIFFHFVL